MHPTFTALFDVHVGLFCLNIHPMLSASSTDNALVPRIAVLDVPRKIIHGARHTSNDSPAFTEEGVLTSHYSSSP